MIRVNIENVECQHAALRRMLTDTSETMWMAQRFRKRRLDLAVLGGFNHVMAALVQVVMEEAANVQVPSEPLRQSHG